MLLFVFAAIGQACSPFADPVNESLSDSYYFSKSGEDVHYSPMGNWFELGNTKLNADAGSFEVIARDFGKDKDHLYFKEYVIDDEADKFSFRVKGDFIGLD